MQDKQAYFRRWPKRYYTIRGDSIDVACGRDVCEVTGLYDWSVWTYSNRESYGVATFRFSIDVATMQIIAEAGEVVPG
jgi:hypothetical protein